MATIMMLSDSPLTVTGYATITWNVLNRLSEQGHTCYAIGHNYVGQPIMPGTTFPDGTQLKFTVLGGSTKPYAQDLIQPYIKKYKPDIFIILLDTFMTYPWLLNIDFSPAKSIFYFPSDGGGGLPLGCENILRKVNTAVAMAKFGQRQCKENYNLETKYIPHAIDLNIYYPLPKEEKEKIKAKWGLQGKFVVGVVQRNQGRKMPDRMIKSFAMFAKDHPDAILFCHTDPYDVAAPVDLIQLITRYKIQNKVIFSGMKFFDGFDYKTMNEVYNMFDVFFLTTSGEGFGIPIIEAMACGVPPVVTDYTTTQELVVEDGECGIPVKVAAELTGSWNVERAIMDDESGAKALKALYDSPELREEYGKIGIEKVKKLYNWKDVGEQWNKLVEDMLK